MSCAHAIEAFNQAYADSHDGVALPVRPAHKTAIVTCMVCLLFTMRPLYQTALLTHLVVD